MPGTKNKRDFKPRHRLRLAAAFAAALAKEKKSPLLTGDREFQSLEKEMKTHWVKQPPISLGKCYSSTGIPTSIK